MEKGQILVLCLLSLAVIFTTAAITLFASKPSLGCLNNHAWEKLGKMARKAGKIDKLTRLREQPRLGKLASLGTMQCHLRQAGKDGSKEALQAR